MPAVLTEKQHTKAAAAHATTIAEEANERHRQAKVATGNTRHLAAAIGNTRQHAATARGTRHHAAHVGDM